MGFFEFLFVVWVFFVVVVGFSGFFGLFFSWGVCVFFGFFYNIFALGLNLSPQLAVSRNTFL